MAEVIHHTDSSGSNLGGVLAVILLAILALVFFLYGLPYLTGGNTGGANVNLPSEVNVNTK